MHVPADDPPDAPLPPLQFRVPTWRVDLKREVDLIEEVGRLHGVDKIPSTPPRGAIGTNAFDSVYDQIGEVRRILTGLGLNEAQGQTLVSNVRMSECRNDEIVALANPLSSDMDVLRPQPAAGFARIRCGIMSAARITTWRCLKWAGCSQSVNGADERRTPRRHRHHRANAPCRSGAATSATRSLMPTI